MWCFSHLFCPFKSYLVSAWRCPPFPLADTREHFVPVWSPYLGLHVWVFVADGTIVPIVYTYLFYHAIIGWLALRPKGKKYPVQFVSSFFVTKTATNNAASEGDCADTGNPPQRWWHHGNHSNVTRAALGSMGEWIVAHLAQPCHFLLRWTWWIDPADRLRTPFYLSRSPSPSLIHQHPQWVLQPRRSFTEWNQHIDRYGW